MSEAKAPDDPRQDLIVRLLDVIQIPSPLSSEGALYEFSIFILRMQEDTLQRVWSKAHKRSRDPSRQDNPRPSLSQGELVTLLHYCVNIFIKKRDKDAPLLQPESTFPFVRPLAETFLEWFRPPRHRRTASRQPPPSLPVIPFENFRRSFSQFLDAIHAIQSARAPGPSDDDMKDNPVVLHLAAQGISISLSELSRFISSLPLETLHAVWERVEKNRDGVVGDSRSLLLLLHVFFCLKIKEQRHDAQYPDPNDEEYLRFMERIVDCLSINFASRQRREQQATAQADFILDGSTSRSVIVVGFEDLVETMPSWLQAVSNMLSQNATEPRSSVSG